MSLRTIRILWILATIVVVIAQSLSIYNSVQSGKFIDDVHHYRDLWKAENPTVSDKDNPWTSSVTQDLGRYSGYIGAVLSIILVVIGNLAIHSAAKNGLPPKPSLFLVLTIFSLIAFAIGVFGVVQDNPLNDYLSKDNVKLKDGTDVVAKLKERYSDLHLHTLDIVDVAFTTVKLVLTAATYWGAYTRSKMTDSQQAI